MKDAKIVKVCLQFEVVELTEFFDEFVIWIKCDFPMAIFKHCV